MTQIVCITNSTDGIIKFFAIKNKDWSWDRLREAYLKKPIAKQSDYDWQGHWYDFVDFIKKRGAVEVDLPTLDVASFPDPEY